jgi:mono/diheme cytochrome c family protein
MRHTTLITFASCLFLILAGLNSQASAQEAQDIGKTEFNRHCASCHGLDGKGKGWVAKMLTTRPSDLTQLSKANEGRCPFIKVQKIIDGREAIVAHGKRDMPLWGARFSEQISGPVTATNGARPHSLEVLVYLNSIQAQ